jgi:hypothetical protein
MSRESEGGSVSDELIAWASTAVFRFSAWSRALTEVERACALVALDEAMEKLAKEIDRAS